MWRVRRSPPDDMARSRSLLLKVMNGCPITSLQKTIWKAEEEDQHLNAQQKEGRCVCLSDRNLKFALNSDTSTAGA